MGSRLLGIGIILPDFRAQGMPSKALGLSLLSLSVSLVARALLNENEEKWIDAGPACCHRYNLDWEGGLLLWAAECLQM